MGKFVVANATLLTNSAAQTYIPLGTWVQVAIVFDGAGKNYVYINNVLRAGPVKAIPNYGNPAPFVVTLGNFDGYIDEVRLSSVARNFRPPRQRAHQYRRDGEYPPTRSPWAGRMCPAKPGFT